MQDLIGESFDVFLSRYTKIFDSLIEEHNKGTKTEEIEQKFKKTVKNHIEIKAKIPQSLDIKGSIMMTISKFWMCLIVVKINKRGLKDFEKKDMFLDLMNEATMHSLNEYQELEYFYSKTCETLFKLDSEVIQIMNDNKKLKTKLTSATPHLTVVKHYLYLLIRPEVFKIQQMLPIGKKFLINKEIFDEIKEDEEEKEREEELNNTSKTKQKETPRTDNVKKSNKTFSADKITDKNNIKMLNKSSGQNSSFNSDAVNSGVKTEARKGRIYREEPKFSNKKIRQQKRSAEENKGKEVKIERKSELKKEDESIMDVIRRRRKEREREKEKQKLMKNRKNNKVNEMNDGGKEDKSDGGKKEVIKTEKENGEENKNENVKAPETSESLLKMEFKSNLKGSSSKNLTLESFLNDKLTQNGI